MPQEAIAKAVRSMLAHDDDDTRRHIAETIKTLVGLEAYVDVYSDVLDELEAKLSEIRRQQQEVRDRTPLPPHDVLDMS